MVPNSIDLAERRLGYFHNAGYFELEGDDFDGVFRLGLYADPSRTPCPTSRRSASTGSAVTPRSSSPEPWP